MALNPLLQPTDYFTNVTFDVITVATQVVDMMNVPVNTNVFTGLQGHLQNASFAKEGKAEQELSRNSPWCLTVVSSLEIKLGMFILIKTVRDPGSGLWVSQTAPYHQYKIDWINASFARTQEKILRLSRRDQIAVSYNSGDGVL